MSKDVTDATFEQDVLARSDELPVIIDLWAPWCGPCRTLGPILEKLVDASAGAVELVKVNIDENPGIAASFRVQSIPAVSALHRRRIVDDFLGALPEKQVAEFVDRLVVAASAPPSEADLLAEAGDEDSLRRALELQPDHERAVVALAGLLTARGETGEALTILARIPESSEVRKAAARARLTAAAGGPLDGAVVTDDASLDARMHDLLEHARDDDDARQELVDLLETMDPEDPRRRQYRRALASRLF